jgi:hypothetical protein
MLPHATRPDPGPKKHSNRAESRPDPRRIRAKNCADSFWIQAGSRSDPACLLLHATGWIQVPKSTSIEPGLGWIQVGSEPKTVRILSGSRPDPDQTQLS